MSGDPREVAQHRGGCGEIINVDAWCDGDAVPSTAGLCDSPAKHREHLARPAAGDTRTDRERLREAVERWLRDRVQVPEHRAITASFAFLALPEVAALLDAAEKWIALAVRPPTEYRGDDSDLIVGGTDG